MGVGQKVNKFTVGRGSRKFRVWEGEIRQKYGKSIQLYTWVGIQREDGYSFLSDYTSPYTFKQNCPFICKHQFPSNVMRVPQKVKLLVTLMNDNCNYDQDRCISTEIGVIHCQVIRSVTQAVDTIFGCGRCRSVFLVDLIPSMLNEWFYPFCQVRVVYSPRKPGMQLFIS